MDKRKFLWLTIPVVSTMAVAAIILLIMQDHFVAVLLVCYFLGVVIGDMLCAKDESSWIINWLSGQRQAQKEVDAEYGTDAEIARRNATDAQSYLAGRVIGGFFKLLFRLLALAFVVAAAGVSWIVRVIASFVRWMKDKPANAASAVPQSQAGEAPSASCARSANQKKQNTGKIVAISVTGGHRFGRGVGRRSDRGKDACARGGSTNRNGCALGFADRHGGIGRRRTDRAGGEWGHFLAG